MNKKYLFSLILSTSIVSFSRFPAEAQMTALCNGCSTRIDAHGACRDVYNGAGAAIMIPWNSAGEWASFINSGTAGVSISACSPPPPPPSASYFYNDIGMYECQIAHCPDGATHGTPCGVYGEYCIRYTGSLNNCGFSLLCM